MQTFITLKQLNAEFQSYLIPKRLKEAEFVGLPSLPLEAITSQSL